MPAQILRALIAVGFCLGWSLQHLYLGLSGNPELYGSFFASYFPFYG